MMIHDCLWDSNDRAMEMASQDVVQAVLLGALPVAVLLLTLVLCQVALLCNNGARRKVEQAEIGAGRILGDESADGKLAGGRADPGAGNRRTHVEVGLTTEGGSKLSDVDYLSLDGDSMKALVNGQSGPRKGPSLSLRFFLRWMLLCLLCCTLALALVLLFGFLAFMSFNESVSRASRHTTHCKILSKGVDLRIARICELNRNSLRPTDSKLWCYLDYYWASVFKVEYWPHLSDLPMQAAAEAPREALPAVCRPDFGVVWRLNEGYQINATYPCKYNPKNLMIVDIAEDITKICDSPKPHLYELISHFLTLVFFSEDTVRASRSAGKAIVSGALGFFSPMLMLVVVRLVRQTYYRWQNSCRQT